MGIFMIALEITCKGSLTMKRAIDEAVKLKEEHPDADFYVKVSNSEN